jgi:hypothetical protein
LLSFVVVITTHIRLGGASEHVRDQRAGGVGEIEAPPQSSGARRDHVLRTLGGCGDDVSKLVRTVCVDSTLRPLIGGIDIDDRSQWSTDGKSLVSFSPASTIRHRHARIVGAQEDVARGAHGLAKHQLLISEYPFGMQECDTSAIRNASSLADDSVGSRGLLDLWFAALEAQDARLEVASGAQATARALKLRKSRGNTMYWGTS